MKQNLASSIILPPKNGGLKVWSHSVRKANSLILLNVLYAVIFLNFRIFYIVFIPVLSKFIVQNLLYFKTIDKKIILKLFKSFTFKP